MRPRSIVYIDGFNLYYGAIRGGPNKWLNLQKYFEMLRQGDDIQKIVYCTAMVDGPGRVRQKTYLQALETLPLIEVVMGRYKWKQVKCTLGPCAFVGKRWFTTPEEKRTDVNIAVRLVIDAYEGKCDRQIIISGDSDLVPAVDAVKQHSPHMKVMVYVPTRNPLRGAATELRGAADDSKDLPLQLLRHAQLPATLTDNAGVTISKPTDW